MKNINVCLGEKTYSIKICKGLLDKASDYVKKIYNNKRITIITDDNVNALYGDKLKQNLENGGFEVDIISIESGEQSKSLSNAYLVLEKLSLIKMKRTDLIIAFGGGVVGDLAGFCASVYLRGVPFVQIPTTLLAMVDSSVGGKTAVDLPIGKNLVGTFYHPKMVLIDTEFLNTLQKHYILDGMGEVIKYACICDREFFEFINMMDVDDICANYDYIVYKCINIKKYYVENDEFDFNERMKLNFGHTIGHAIECYFRYKQYSHGEAVCIGMYNLTKLTEKYGITQAGVSELIKRMLCKYGLEYRMPYMDAMKVLDIVKNDKKNISNILNCVVLTDLGKSAIYHVDTNKIEKYLGELLN